MFRRDRDCTSSSKQEGGGVLIATNKTLNAVEESTWISGAEDLWVTIRLEDKTNIHLGCVYLPPNDTEAATLFCAKLIDIVNVKVKNNDTVLLCGDFNLSKVEWSKSANSLNHILHSNDQRTVTLIDTFSLCNLFQFSNILNDNNRSLDLIFSNSLIIQNVHECDPFTPNHCHHKSFNFTFPSNINFRSLNQNNTLKYIFNKGNYDKINNDISNFDWNILENLTVEESLELFTNVLTVSINKNIPRKRVQSSKFPCWYSSSTIKCYKEKIKIHKKWKIYKNNIDYLTFKLLRGRCKYLISIDYKNYVKSIEINITSNPAKIWTFMSDKKSLSNIPNILYHENNVADNGTDITELFSAYFQSVYVTPQHLVNQPNISTLIDSKKNYFTEDEVKTKISNLDVTKGPGSDNIPNLLLKKCSDTICVPLTKIFNKSLSTGNFPSKWKESYIIPIHKSGNKNLINNYRPISILNSMGKLLESLINKMLFAFVKSDIINEQHGFVPSRGVETNLLSFTQNISNSMDDRVQTDAVYTDFSKAFDKINHRILIKRLTDVGIHGDLLRWLKSYISNRTQAVKINNFVSSFKPVISGVPQGSHLGPTLFIIYINNIKQCFKHSNILLYADDLKIFRKITCLNDCTLLQQDLSRLNTYCHANDLYLNLTKCFSISFTRNISPINFDYVINNKIIKHVTEIKDLGIILDQKLTYEKHIDYVSKKSNKMLGFIMRSARYFYDFKCFKSLYFAYVNSQLSFASVIWNPQYNKYIDRIENIQRKFLIYVCSKRAISINVFDYNECCKFFKIIKLQDRRKINDITYARKILNGSLHVPNILSDFNFLVPNHFSRSQHLLYNNLMHTNHAQNSPIYRLTSTINYHSFIDPFYQSQNIIKNLLTAHFLQSY